MRMESFDLRTKIYLVDVRFFFRKAELGDTLVLDLDKEVVLEKFFDEGVFERCAVTVGVVESCDVIMIKEARGEVGNGIVGRAFERSFETLDEFRWVEDVLVWRGIAGVSTRHEYTDGAWEEKS